MVAAEGVEGVEGEAKVFGEAVEGRPAVDAAPWLSLPQCQGHRWGGQAVFHERHEIP